MTAEERITKYINKHYKLVWTHGYAILTEGRIAYYAETKDELKQIFGLEYIHIMEQWFKVNKDILNAKIYDVLNNCSVQLRRADWVLIDKDSRPITEIDIHKIINDKNIPLDMVDYIVEKWMEDKIIEVSTKIIENKL